MKVKVTKEFRLPEEEYDYYLDSITKDMSLALQYIYHTLREYNKYKSANFTKEQIEICGKIYDEFFNIMEDCNIDITRLISG